MEPVSRRPRLLSASVAVLAGLVTVGAAGFYSWNAIALGAVGVFLLAAGLATARNGIVTGGAAALVVSAFLAGLAGAPPVPLLLAAIAAILAGDLGNTAIGLGAQLGTDARTYRLEATHMGASGFVGVLTGGLGYGLFQVGAGGQPIVALVFLVVAAVLLVEAIG